MPELTDGVDQPNAGNPTKGSPDNNPQPQEADFGFNESSVQEPVADPASPDGPDTKPETTDQGLVTRLEQAKAKQAKVLKALNIDPDSVLIDQFEQGLISADDLRRMASPASYPQQAVPQQQAEKTPMQVVEETLNRVRTNKDATLEDFETMCKAQKSFMEQVSNDNQKTQFDQMYKDCESAVQNVYEHTISGTSNLDDTLKMTERELFVAATDFQLVQDANKSPNPSGMVNPQAYGFYANRTAEKMDKLRNAYIEQGRKLEREGVPPAPAQRMITPAAPGQGAPVRAPKVKVTVDNMHAAREQYMRNYNKQV